VVRADLAELALGVLTGEERARALAHLEWCEECAAELASLAAVADLLSSTGPDAEPPAGFELRVLERIRGEQQIRRPRRIVSRRLAAVAAAAAVLLAGAFVGSRMSHSSAPSQHGALVPTTEPGLRVAELTSAGSSRGEVYAYGYATNSPWLLMTVSGLPAGTEVTCEVTTRSGKTFTVGSFWLGSSSGSWGSPLPVSPAQLASARVVTASGAVLARASFPT
jgi:anti-sigma factor RsiW